MQKSVKKVVENNHPHWVGDGFPVRSLFNYLDGNEYDPFLILDYAGPYEFRPGTAKRGVGGHPHKGFETVTIVYDGELEHRDSSGSQGVIGKGDVQWMTAGSGLLHEEFHSQRFTREGGILEMVQLWVNLPAVDKNAPPGYQEIVASQIPTVELEGGAGTARVIAGALASAAGPAKTFTPMNVLDLRLVPGKRFTLPVADGHTALAIIQKGKVKVNESTDTEAVQLVQFDRAGTEITLQAESDAMVLVLTGEPINEPIYGRGPFVMNTQDEIRQAIVDFQSGKMGSLD
ncbi:pirin family protein [Planctomicrobium sp. SH668]|uniref:pirin family protein n=1 Tax=Planctomicrobium sp. SH668 TaxID=3448126 RepID=UPI003F5BAF41